MDILKISEYVPAIYWILKNNKENAGSESLIETKLSWRLIRIIFFLYCKCSKRHFYHIISVGYSPMALLSLATNLIKSCGRINLIVLRQSLFNFFLFFPSHILWIPAWMNCIYSMKIQDSIFGMSRKFFRYKNPAIYKRETFIVFSCLA